MVNLKTALVFLSFIIGCFFVIFIKLISIFTAEQKSVVAISASPGIIQKSSAKSEILQSDQNSSKSKIGTARQVKSIRMALLGRKSHKPQTTLKSASIRDSYYRQRLLDSLVWRINAQDLVDWDNIDLKNSQAKRFIRVVDISDPEAARYLNTSAYIFSKLYKSILSEEPIQFKEMVSDNRVTEVAGLTLVDFYDDPAFKSAYDQVFYSLFSEYLASSNVDYVYAISLASQLDISISQFSSDKMVDLIYNASLKHSPRERMSILKNNIRVDSFYKFAKQSPEVGEFVGILYIVAGLDAIEFDEIKLAKDFLNNSVKIWPGIDQQEKLSLLIAKKVRSNPEFVVAWNNFATQFGYTVYG